MSCLTDTVMERKITVLDSGVFPILKVENFLTETEYADIKNEVRTIACMQKKDMAHHATFGRDYRRVYLDPLFGANRAKSKILAHISKNLFENKMLEVYDSIKETAFKLLHSTTNHETQLTFYHNNCEYNWHNDNDQMRLVNFVFMVDMGMKFEGGHTLISNSKWEEKNFLAGVDIPVALDIEPKGNQLIIMPCWVTHSVTKTKMKTKGILDGRITVNGHIGFRNFQEGMN